MNTNLRNFLGGCGCGVVVSIILLTGFIVLFPAMSQWFLNNLKPASARMTATPEALPGHDATATAAAPPAESTPRSEPFTFPDGAEDPDGYLNQLYTQVSPGVVSIYVDSLRGGSGAGSGFIFDTAGHIVTNNHVVAGADLVMVFFHDGAQARAEVVGVDPDSDLAVVRAEMLPESAAPLPIGDVETVMPGDWVIAIGNPFGLNSSMSIGIVSAIGRTIPSGATPFSIPLAIQTDAAINPGNSGGPLLNLDGEVIGVNAQIATQSGTNAGVGFSIPANIVKRVVPVLIEEGSYEWAWLGVRGTSVNILIQEANGLAAAQGAYLLEVVPGGPADEAGLQGGDEIESVNGIQVPSGGDVIVEADGMPIESYTALQLYIAEQEPGTTVELSVLRDGERLQIPVQLAPRPAE
ncbi:MAG: S1C family serine protease [Chloroflexota bacterium]